MTTEVVIEAEALWTRIAGNIIHRDLNLRVNRGEIAALVGGSGSGKTVLLRALVGLLPPLRGSVRMFGVELARARQKQRIAVQRRFGMLFQHGALFSALNVFDNVALPLRELRLLDERMIRDLVMLKLSLVELEPEAAHRMPAELSGGMIKRVSLARALALDPELLVLDEPTAGLDPERSRKFVRLIKALSRELGLTVFMVTHDVETLSTLASHVCVLADQHIVADGRFETVLQSPHPFVREFFGDQDSLLHSAAGTA